MKKKKYRSIYLTTTSIELILIKQLSLLELIIRTQGGNINGEINGQLTGHCIGTGYQDTRRKYTCPDISGQLPYHRVGTGNQYTRRKYTWRYHWTITWPPCWNWLSGHNEEIYLERSLDKASQPKKKIPLFNNEYFFQFSPYFQFFKVPVLTHISSFYTKVK